MDEGSWQELKEKCFHPSIKREHSAVRWIDGNSIKTCRRKNRRDAVRIRRRFIFKTNHCFCFIPSEMIECVVEYLKNIFSPYTIQEN